MPLPYRVHHHELYGTWCMMQDRCRNPRNGDFHRYGGRGIKVSAEWPNTRTFIDWCETQLGPRPPGFTLDRIDTSGDYAPGNVRWADYTEQATNRRSTIQAICDGEPMSLYRALRTIGLNHSQATYSIVRMREGMSIEDAASIYPHVDPSRITVTHVPPKRIWRLDTTQ